MDNKKAKRFYGIFFGIFIIIGLSLLIFGFVKLARYNYATEIDATVISTEYNFEKDEMTVLFEFELNSENFTTNGYFSNIKYKDGHLPYYKGLQTKIHINNKNQIVTYGKNEIIITIGGCLFLLAGNGFLYFFVLRRRRFFDIACDYEKAMVNPDDLSDDTAIYEAKADALSKLPAYKTKRLMGEVCISKYRILDRLRTFSIVENVIFNIFLLGLIIFFVIILRSILFGIIFGMFVFVFSLLPVKIVHSMYIKILVKMGKFSEKKLATVTVCAYESEGSFQKNHMSRKYTIFKKFRVVAIIDGKRSVGYVLGNVPPPKGSILKVLVRPHRLGRWIIDNT